jgi:molecular chaperone GrpE
MATAEEKGLLNESSTLPAESNPASRLDAEKETLAELVKDIPNQAMLIEKLQSKADLQWSDLVSFYRMALYGLKDMLTQKEEALKKSDAAPSNEDINSLKEELEVLKQTISSHEETIRNRDEAVKDALKIIDRLKQDFENLRLRNRLEKTNLARNAKKDLLLNLLEIVDNFERAQTALLNTENVRSVVDGIAMMANQFNQLLKSEGLTEILIGDAVDPTIHEVIQEEIKPDLEVELKLEELRRGYYYEGMVLRPAWIKVIRKEKKEIVTPKENKDIEIGNNNDIN